MNQHNYKDFKDGKISTREFTDIVQTDKKTRFRSKNIGELNAKINSFFLGYVQQFNIPVPLFEYQSPNVISHQTLELFPFGLKVLNVYDKKNSRIFLKKELEVLQVPLYEFYVGEFLEHFVGENHISSLELSTAIEIKMIQRIASKANAVLKSFFERRNITLMELNLLFGKSEDKIFLIGDFSPIKLKLLSESLINQSINPYKISSSQLLKKYSEIIYEQINS